MSAIKEKIVIVTGASSGIGRFINADDTAFIGYNGMSVSVNIFVYCCNNPTNRIDVFGMWGKDVHSGYYSKESKAKKINGKKYGTYFWALSVGFSKNNAKIIAEACNDIDSIYPPWIPTRANQSWLFNCAGNGIDSRTTHAISCVIIACELAEEAMSLYNARNSRCKKN